MRSTGPARERSGPALPSCLVFRASVTWSVSDFTLRIIQTHKKVLYPRFMGTGRLKKVPNLIYGVMAANGQEGSCAAFTCLWSEPPHAVPTGADGVGVRLSASGTSTSPALQGRGCL